MHTDAELAKLVNEKHGVWSKDHMLMATLIDSVQMLTYFMLSRWGVKQEPPEPLKRPGVVSKAQSNQQDFLRRAAFLLELREKNAHTETG